MLRSEINELEKTVGAILEDNGTPNPSGYQKRITEQVAYVKNLCSELKKKWTHELLSSAKEQVIKRYVQFHQAGIIQLSDEVGRHEPALNIPEDIRAVKRESCRRLNAHLEDVLEFLYRYFYHYFDIDHQASLYHCRLLGARITSFEPELKIFQSKAVDGSLIACVLTSVNEIANEGIISGISYRQADQCLNIVRMTQQLLLFGTHTTTESLIKALYQQNLNSLYFYHWYQDHVSEQMTKIGDKIEQQDFIKHQIKAFAGIFVNPAKAVQQELPSTDVFILPWLQKQTGAPEKPKFKLSFQLPLNLSVPQFALFIRIFYKTGCFPVENVALITRFFTEHFTTKKQPHISHKSFGRAFYSLDQSAAAVVRDFLQKMLNYLNKTYFP